jgi:hypothetical protein
MSHRFLDVAALCHYCFSTGPLLPLSVLFVEEAGRNVSHILDEFGSVLRATVELRCRFS